MKRIIFCIYDDIKKPNDSYNVNYFATLQVEEYWDRLLKNKQDYADSIGVEFKLYRNTMKDFEVEYDLEFTKVNLYKHHLFAELAKQYDEVMYVDMDVVFNTKENIFEQLDLSKGIHIQHQDSQIKNKDINAILFNQVGQRNPTLKYHITKDLLNGKDCHVLNTGIMIGKSQHINQIKFLERIPDLTQQIYDIKSKNLESKDSVYLRMFYYPNNEALFSYIVEHYNVPYVLMDPEWHFIFGNELKEVDWNEIKVAHIINKKFNCFFNDKTKCIYSIHIDIPEERLDNPRGPYDDDVPKSKRTKERLLAYKDRLDQNHKDYAELVGAEYIHFGRDEQYEEFFNRFPDLSEYDVINLYKVWLLDQLTHKYDLVLYIDYDVYFADKYDIFNYLFGEHLLCVDINDAFESGINVKYRDYFKEYNKDFRNPQAKYWNAHAMLQEQDLDGDNWVFNTGIMLTSRSVMEQVDYFSDIEDTIEMMKELKEDSMYPDNVRESFGYDNETIMSYKTTVNKVPLSRLDEKWHYKHNYNRIECFDIGSKDWKTSKKELELDIKEKQVQLIHFISKNFSLVFDENGS